MLPRLKRGAVGLDRKPASSRQKQAVNRCWPFLDRGSKKFNWRPVAPTCSAFIHPAMPSFQIMLVEANCPEEAISLKSANEIGHIF